MPKSPKHLSNLAVRYQVLIERLKSGQVRDFMATFQKLDKATARIISELAVENLNQLSKAKLRVVLSELSEVNTKIINDASKKLFKNLNKIASNAAVFEKQSIQSVAKVKIAKPVNEKVFQFVLGEPLSATGELLEPFISDLTRVEVKRINNLITKGYSEGWTNQRLVQGVRGTRVNGFNDGILATSRRNASAMVRTSVQHVATTGRMATLTANQDVVKGYSIVATLDAKTTVICRSLDGRHFKFGEGPKPPLHINCRSTIIADLDDELDFLDEGGTRSSEFGPVPADQTYYDWLKRQPASFQRDALGATRAKLFQSGGLNADEFARLNLNRNFEPLSLAEMAKKMPSVFEKAGVSL